MATSSLLDHVTDLHVETPLPTMYRVRQHFDAPDVGDIPAAVARQFTALDGRIEPGMRVGVTAGSRGLANIPVILRAVGKEIRQRGGHPFIIPAMGSHGGATAEGQEEVLASYGITERTTAMPIVSAMDVRQIGQLPDGPAVYMSTTALEADALLIVGRVKPHTDFRADIESGLAKIMTIGLGKHRGAQMIHSYGTGWPEPLATTGVAVDGAPCQRARRPGHPGECLRSTPPSWSLLRRTGLAVRTRPAC